MRGPAAATFFFVSLTALLLVSGQACDDEVAGPCPGGCPFGQICDPEQGVCLELRPEAVPADLGRYLSAALDESGRRVFAAYAKRYGDLVFAKEKDDGTFEYEYVDGLPFAYSLQSDLRADPVAPVLLGDNVGLYASLALGPLDRPHIAYFDRSNGRLKYAVKTVEGWDVVTVPRAGEDEHVVGRAASLALDAEGQPHIAFLDEDLGVVKVARNSSDGRWAIERVTTCDPNQIPGRVEREMGRSLGMVLDQRGGEWLAMRDPCSGKLQLAYRSNSTWSLIALDAGPDAGTWLSAALDPKGNLAVVYHDRAHGSLNYAWNDDGSVRTMVLDDGLEVGERGALLQRVVGSHCHLIYGSDGQAIIVYLDAARQDLRLLHGDPESGFSEPEVLMAEGPVGLFGAILPAADHLCLGSFRYGRTPDGQGDGQVVWTDKALVDGSLR